MRSFSFLHCADLHLGAPFKGVGSLPDELRRRLLDAPAAALENAVSTAIERRVAAVLMAGDVFDAADRNLRAQIQLRDQLQRLHEAGVSTFLAAGNHDHLGGRVASIRYPDSVHLFGPRVESVPLQAEGTTLARVYGVSYGAPRQRDPLIDGFPRDPDGPFSIGLLHANVGNRSGHADYAPCSLEDLRVRDFDYWALGHVHTRETLSPEKPIVHYPGNTQGLHGREIGRRGATLVEISANGAVTVSPIWTDVVRWHARRSSIAELATTDDLMDGFGELVEILRGEAPDRFHLLRWTLAGRGPLHRELRRAGYREEIVEELRDRHRRRHAAGTVWLDRLEVETRPEQEIESLRQRQDLLGDILRIAEEARECRDGPPLREIGSERSPEPEPEICEQLRDGLTDLLDSHRLRNALGEEPWSAVSWKNLLLRAENLSIEALSPDDEESPR